MSTLRNYFFIAILFLSPFLMKAQDGEPPPPVQPIQDSNATVTEDDAPAPPKRYYLLSPRVSVTVPHPMANRSFKKCFVGIYEVSGGLNVYLYKGFFIGAAGKNGLLKITENKIADYNASMQINNVYGRIGGDFYINEKHTAIFSLAASAGKNYTKYMGLVSRDPKNPPAITSYNCTFIEPEVNMFFLIESNFGIGVTVSYSIYSKNFDPYELRLNDWAAFSHNNTGPTEYLSFGFGFYYSMIQKNKKKGGY